MQPEPAKFQRIQQDAYKVMRKQNNCKFGACDEIRGDPYELEKEINKMKILNSKYFGIGFVTISTAFLALIDFIGVCELSIFAILSPMVLLVIPVFIFLAWLIFKIVISFAELTNDILTKIEKDCNNHEN